MRVFSIHENVSILRNVMCEFVIKPFNVKNYLYFPCVIIRAIKIVFEEEKKIITSVSFCERHNRSFSTKGTFFNICG